VPQTCRAKEKYFFAQPADTRTGSQSHSIARIISQKATENRGQYDIMGREYHHMKPCLHGIKPPFKVCLGSSGSKH
jgi:hypothetical protein